MARTPRFLKERETEVPKTEPMTFAEFNNGQPPRLIVFLYHDPDDPRAAAAERVDAAGKLREIADRIEDGDYGCGEWTDSFSFAAERDLVGDMPDEGDDEDGS